jgi:hypothetical protein
MKFAESTKLHRKSGMWGTLRFIAKTEFKSFGGASPVVFVPRTLRRTWGTRPVPGRSAAAEGQTADPRLAPTARRGRRDDKGEGLLQSAR